MSKSLQSRVFVILGVLLACIYFALPLEKRINLGLDLKGGMHLIMRVETEKLDDDAKSDAVLRAMEILRNRIDSLGVGETVIQRQGEEQILVQLPGVTDRDKAIAIVKQVAHLEFKLVESDPTRVSEALAGTIPLGYELKYIKDEESEPILVAKEVAMEGDGIANAKVDFDQTGFQPKIALSFNSEGTDAFGTLTTQNVGERLAIILDGEVLSAPSIREPILTGTAEISGDFTYEEASILSLALRSGSLPAPMVVEEERTIGPLLGKDSINAGVTATVIGTSLVLIFMIFYYFIGGIISSIALGVNLIMIVGIMGFVNATLPESQMTLTLPGIAGIILTLGMAVDANVLINERIREELDNERPLSASVSSGFNKAFKAIIDSNLTTLIAAFMLFQFGSGPIKGFAVTLTIGLLASLFTALFVTRTLFLVLLDLRMIKNLPMLRIFKNPRFDFVSKRYFAFALSAVMLVVGIVTVFQKGNDAYGIDFVGGQIQEYRFNEPVDVERLRNTLAEAGVGDVVLQQFDQIPENIIIRTAEDSYETVNKTLKEKMGDNSYELMRVEKVGPVVGKALRKRAILAIAFALGGILIFVGFRFKHFDFATAGIVALLHDVILTLGVLVFLGRQIDLLVVTALLTIAGYSVNDTIIIYDRVRENLVKMRKLSFPEIINLSINQTLGRTILTTITTLLVVVTLYLKGGEVLNTFALCLLIGFIAGTYSTIFIASPLVLAWQKKSKK